MLVTESRKKNTENEVRKNQTVSTYIHTITNLQHIFI